MPWREKLRGIGLLFCFSLYAIAFLVIFPADVLSAGGAIVKSDPVCIPAWSGAGLDVGRSSIENSLFGTSGGAMAAILACENVENAVEIFREDGVYRLEKRDLTSLLHHALSRDGFAPLVAELLDAGADANSSDAAGRTVLMMCLKCPGFAADEDYVISRFENYSAVDKNGRTALFYCGYRARGILSALIDRGCPIDARDASGDTALMTYIKAKNTSNVAELIRLGAGVDAANASSEAALVGIVELFCEKDFEDHEWNSDVVIAAIKSSKNVNIIDSKGNTPLHYAARSRRVELIKALISAGAKVDIANASGETPLMFSRDGASAGVLLDAGAKFDVGDPAFRDPKVAAGLFSIAGQEAVDEIVSRNISKINMIDDVLIGAFIKYGKVPGLRSLLMIARRKGECGPALYDRISTILDPASKDFEYYVFTCGDFDILKYFMNNRLIVFKVDKIRDWFLALSAAGNGAAVEMVVKLAGQSDKMKLFDLYLEHAEKFGNNVSAAMARSFDDIDAAGRVKLLEKFVAIGDTEGVGIIAARETDRDAGIKIITDHFIRLVERRRFASAISFADLHPEIDIVRLVERRPVIVEDSLRSANIELLRYLFEKIGFAAFKENFNSIAVHRAAAFGNIRALKWLEERGMEMGVRDTDGGTAMIDAAMAGNVEVMKILKNAGLGLDDNDRFGRTPLVEAVFRGNHRVVKWLLDGGADTETLYEEAQYRTTALGMAIETGRPGIAGMIFEKSRNIDARSSWGMNLLHMAARSGDVRLVNYYHGLGIGTDREDLSRTTPLAVAVDNGKRAAALRLLELGADPLKSAKFFGSPLEVAYVKGYSDIASAIVKRLKDDGRAKCIASAISEGRYIAVEKMLNEGFGPDLVHDGRPLAVVAVEARKKDILKLLIERKADLNRPDRSGNTSLHHACLKGDPESFKMLVAAGASIDARNFDGDTMMIAAAGGGELGIVMYLVENKQDPGIRNRFGATAIAIASKFGYSKIVEYLVGLKVDIDASFFRQGEFGNPIVFASARGDLRLVGLLLEKNARVDGAAGVEALTVVSGSNAEDIVRLLVEKGADVNGFSRDGRRVVEVAIAAGKEGVTALLLEKGAYFQPGSAEGSRLMSLVRNKFSKKGCKLLSGWEMKAEVKKKFDRAKVLNDAVSNNDKRAVCEILSSGYEVDIKDECGVTPMIAAVETGSVEMIRLLASKGANLNFHGKLDSPPLFFAVRKRDVAAAEALIEKGAGTEHMNAYFETPLSLAVSSSDEIMVELLLMNKAVADICGPDGVTPLILAAACGGEGMVKKLVAHGARIDARDASGRTPLIAACESYNSEVARALVDVGAQLPDEIGMRTYVDFFMAIRSGSLPKTKEIIGSGANVNCRGPNGHTPLIAALKSGRFDICNALIDAGAGIEATARDGASAREMAMLSGDRGIYEAYSARGIDLKADERKYYLKEYHSAIMGRNEEKALAAIEKVGDPDARDENGSPVAALAIFAGFDRVNEWLWKRGVDLSATDGTRRSVLVIGVETCRLTDNFFDRGRNLERAVRSARDIIARVRPFNSRYIKILAKHGARIENISGRGASLVYEGIFANDYDKARDLLQLGADFRKKYSDGTDALMLLCGKNPGPDPRVLAELMRLLVSRGADVNARDNAGNGPLHHAANSLNSDAAKGLLGYGADPGAANSAGLVPMQIAASKKSGNELFVKTLSAGGGRYFRKRPAVIEYEEIKALAGFGNPAVARIVSGELASEGVMRDELIARIVSGGSKKEMHIFASAASKRNVPFETLDGRFFPAVVLNDPEHAGCVIDYGDHQYISHFVKRGMRFCGVRQYDEKVAEAIKAADTSEFSFAVGCVAGFDEASARKFIDAAHAAKNSEFMKAIVAKTEKLDMTYAGSRIGVFIDNCDTTGILLTAGRMASAEERERFFGSALEKVRATSNSTVDFYMEIFKKGFGRDGKVARNQAKMHMCWAASGGRDDIAMALDSIFRGGGKKYMSPLLVYSVQKPSLVMKLLESGADPFSRDEYGKSAIVAAAESGCRESMKLLLRDERAMKKSEMSDAAYCIVGSNGSTDLLQLLIEYGADLNRAGSIGCSPLFMAVSMGKKDHIRFLIDNGALVDKRTVNGQEIVKMAEKSKDPEIRSMIGKFAIAPLSPKEAEAVAGLNECIKKGETGEAVRLIDSGVAFDSCDRYARTPLSYAAEHGREEIVRFLLGKGANMETLSNMGETPLRYAAQFGRHRIVKLMAENGADVNASSTARWDALRYSIYCHDSVSSHYLLKNGAGRKYSVDMWEQMIEKTFSEGWREIADQMAEAAYGHLGTAPVGIRSFPEIRARRKLSSAMIDAYLNGDTRAVALAAGKNRRDALNGDLIFSMIEKSILAGDAGMSGTLAAYMSDIKLIKKLLSRDCAGEGTKKAYFAFASNLPESVCEKEIDQIIRCFLDTFYNADPETLEHIAKRYGKHLTDRSKLAAAMEECRKYGNRENYGVAIKYFGEAGSDARPEDIMRTIVRIGKAANDGYMEMKMRAEFFENALGKYIYERK